MKKILYTLLSASLLVASCTKEIPVTGNHDVIAEVTPSVTMEYKTLFCNLNDAPQATVESLLSYVDVQLTNEVELAILTVASTDVSAIEAYCAEKEYQLSKCVTGNVATCAIAKEGIVEMGNLADELVGMGALFVQYKSHYYIVSSLIKGTTELTCTQRTQQVEAIIEQTLAKPEFASNAPWIAMLNMNALAHIDVVKYGLPYMDAEYDPEIGPTAEQYSWQFASHDPLLYNNFVDCVAAQFSNYPYADGEWRYDFIYATPKAWQIMQPMVVDYSASYLAADKSKMQEDEGEGEGEGDDEGEGDEPVIITPIQPGTLAVYPIIITLKSEEK